jgi:hypothetical protein
MLVARELNRIGVRKVDGDLVVVPPFWLGWENGSEEPRDPVQRNLDMANRLLRSLERGRWKAPQLRAWRAMCARRGWHDEPEPGS